jgi:hypothetical protein
LRRRRPGRHIGRHDRRTTACLPDVVGGLLGFALRPAIREHQVHAPAGERTRDSAADALAAGDDGDLVE